MRGSHKYNTQTRTHSCTQIRSTRHTVTHTCGANRVGVWVAPQRDGTAAHCNRYTDMHSTQPKLAAKTRCTAHTRVTPQLQHRVSKPEGEIHTNPRRQPHLVAKLPTPRKQAEQWTDSITTTAFIAHTHRRRHHYHHVTPPRTCTADNPHGGAPRMVG